MPIALKRLAGRFGSDDRGTVTVEFVIVLPLLMLWFVGSFVFFQTYRNFSHAEKASFAISDIMSRQSEVDSAFLDELDLLFERLLPRRPTGQWLRVSSISYDAANGYEVLWSHNAAGGDVVTDASALGEFLPAMADGDTVILTETYVPYRPMVDWVGIPAMTFANRVVARPRYVSAVAKTD